MDIKQCGLQVHLALVNLAERILVSTSENERIV